MRAVVVRGLSQVAVETVEDALIEAPSLAALGVLATLMRAGPPDWRSGSRSEGDPERAEEVSV